MKALSSGVRLRVEDANVDVGAAGVAVDRAGEPGPAHGELTILEHRHGNVAIGSFWRLTSRWRQYKIAQAQARRVSILVVDAAENLVGTAATVVVPDHDQLPPAGRAATTGREQRSRQNVSVPRWVVMAALGLLGLFGSCPQVMLVKRKVTLISLLPNRPRSGRSQAPPHWASHPIPRSSLLMVLSNAPTALVWPFL